MIPACKLQKQRIAILVKGDKELKKHLVQEYTQDQSKTSTNDLTHLQANQIIQSFGQKPIQYDNWAFYDKTKKSHLYILSLAIQFGWAVHDNKYGQIADLHKISQWLKSKKAPVQKKLKAMSPIEVSRTITALENMVTGKYK